MTITRGLWAALWMALGAGALWGPSAWAEKSIADFERYVDGQIIGEGPTSQPWRRFGGATNDNLVITNHPDHVISGALSAQYCVYWPNTFGALRYVFDQPMDLSQYAAASFVVLACNISHADDSAGASDQPVTYTTAVLAITNGVTTYESVTPQPITPNTQEVVVYLTDQALHSTDGTQSFSEVIEHATQIGMTFRSSEGMYTETIVIDDFKLLTQQVASGKDPAEIYLDLD